MQGYLSIVLHAHLPFVRHPEHEKFLEGKLAVRGDHRDLHPAHPDPRRLAARRYQRADHRFALAHALHHAARPAAAWGVTNGI
ncbi:MAG: hypothetical protein WDN00_07505 [Limisphaerales bacterium]